MFAMALGGWLLGEHWGVKMSQDGNEHPGDREVLVAGIAGQHDSGTEDIELERLARDVDQVAPGEHEHIRGLADQAVTPILACTALELARIGNPAPARAAPPARTRGPAPSHIRSISYQNGHLFVSRAACPAQQRGRLPLRGTPAVTHDGQPTTKRQSSTLMRSQPALSPRAPLQAHAHLG
jgi:hypothetical protein